MVVQVILTDASGALEWGATLGYRFAQEKRESPGRSSEGLQLEGVADPHPSPGRTEHSCAEKTSPGPRGQPNCGNVRGSLIHLARRLRDLEFSGILRIRGRGDVAAGASLRFTAEVRWPGPRFGLFLGIKSRRGAVVGWGGMGNDVLASDD